MMQGLKKGTVHSLPSDLAVALTQTVQYLDLWNDLTPLGRNEFICWITSAKLPETRTRRIKRTIEELTEGKRRPCCWAGCQKKKKNGR